MKVLSKAKEEAKYIYICWTLDPSQDSSGIFEGLLESTTKL